jgi:hypothetical protein
LGSSLKDGAVALFSQRRPCVAPLAVVRRLVQDALWRVRVTTTKTALIRYLDLASELGETVMKRCVTTLSALAALLSLAGVGQATIIGFGQLGGNNTTVPAALGSNATADGNGLVVSNGATPNIALTWDANWDIHTSNFFAPLEGQTVGGGDWDNEGNIPRIGQLDSGTHTVNFAAAPGSALVLNSFDFGHTAETAGSTNWDLTLADSGSNVVWSQSVSFVDGQTVTVAPNFTGALGGSYTLTFNRTSESYNSNGRHGIDNLNFNESAVPEPGCALLVGLGIAGTAAGLRRRS